MTGEPGDDFPVLDDGALQDLKDDAGEAAAQAFIEDYLLLLLARGLKIFKTLRRGDPAERLDAVLSLRASSEMVGAVRLAAYCCDIEKALKNGQSPDVGSVQKELSTQICNVIREASLRGHFPPKRRRF
ncbi:hypothetical protein [Arthrobacter sp. ISL-65]|uniref:hypothetical protein n=1 Tax=Arthrobacter sp. ISL-65 TaxID=2819112 RepID=UPI001BEC9422|nr:hypothetical protein [Arthrobacter sp. ISL-65]MBT2550981.1 hypothetical protein [Arthrobacter sp. ISL-65]